MSSSVRDEKACQEKKKTAYLGEKLKLQLRLREKGGVETPVARPWKLWAEQADDTRTDRTLSLPLPSLSARKLAATLSDIHPYLPRSRSSMSDLSTSCSSSSNQCTSSAPSGVDFTLERCGYYSEVARSKGKLVESGCDFRTSSELLKVLNRIWSLEEQHESNLSLVRTLTKELDEARLQIRDLLRDCEHDRSVDIDQDRVNAVLQSMEDELDDERRLRKRSENLHRKLARELAEIRSDLEREQRSRILLEDLCDLFAEKVRDDEHELRQKREDWIEKNDRDRLILHVSERWLDERMQARGTIMNSVVENLRSEIEIFKMKSPEPIPIKETVNLHDRDNRDDANSKITAPSSAILQRSSSDCKKLMLKSTSSDHHVLHSSSKLQSDDDQNSLKAKLLEERAKSKTRSRFNVFKIFV